MRSRLLILCAALSPAFALAGPYAPAADEIGTTAIPYDSAGILGWATGFQDLVRGPIKISDLSQGYASFGSGANALGAADAQIDSLPVVSLGDGGHITLTFGSPIRNGPGADFAVFENGFDDSFLELAFVEVSSNGTTFTPFHSVSLTQTATQVGSAPFSIDPTDLNNLAGKYRRGFGTPFDLAELAGIPGLDINNITHVRITDVVGSIDPLYRTLDSDNHPINDPWPTTFPSGGFDLDAVGVLNFASAPEPCTSLMLMSAALIFTARRRR